MPRAIWSGSISFGLVNVPVRMYSAIDEQDVRFHLLHERDDSRIGYEKVCKKERKPVPEDEIVRGYEVAEGKYVYVTDEDLEAAAGESYHSIDIQDFVDVDEVDSIYFERSSYLGPAAGGEKTYALLVRAMEDSGLVGIATYVMRDKQQLGCLRIRDGLIVLEKMFFADEIRPTGDIAPPKARVGKQELATALDLIDRFRGTFDPEKYAGHVSHGLAPGDRAQAQGQGGARRPAGEARGSERPARGTPRERRGAQPERKARLSCGLACRVEQGGAREARPQGRHRGALGDDEGRAGRGARVGVAHLGCRPKSDTGLRLLAPRTVSDSKSDTRRPARAAAQIVSGTISIAPQGHSTTQIPQPLQ